MSNLRPEDFHVDLDELRATGAKARVKPDVQKSDPLTRFLEVPNHALFLFTSEDVLLDQYIREHWAALDGLSGEICDVYVSISQLQGLEDVYSQLDEVRSIRGLTRIAPSMLPALHIWSTDAHLTLSLKDVGDDLEKLRDALRNIFGSMSSLGGPVTEAWVDGMRSWNAPPMEEGSSGGIQSVSHSVAGRDIIQITNFYQSGPSFGELTMNPTHSSDSDSPREQTIEDVEAGGKISQSSESENDAQTIRRASTPGDVTQTKRKTAEMKFLGGTAGGWGIVGLVIVILAWIAYQAFLGSA